MLKQLNKTHFKMIKKALLINVLFFTVMTYWVLDMQRQNKKAAIITEYLKNAAYNYKLSESAGGKNSATGSENEAHQIHMNNLGIYKDIADEDWSLTKNEIFWSDNAEAMVPKGLSLEHSLELVHRLRDQFATSLKPGTKTKCGLSKGGKVVLEDGTEMCAKYKRKQRSVFAEVLAYYLSRLLQLNNVPEVFLASTDRCSERWKFVEPRDVSWKENETVALVAWQNDTSFETVMPEEIHEAFLDGKIITSNVVNTVLKRNLSHIPEIIQWGSIIIFDDLIGHYDRLVRKGEVQTGSLHNGVKSSEGKIWLIDHESAFFYRYEHLEITFNYIHIVPFYEKLLKTMCVFQTSLVEGLQRLSQYPSPFQKLWDYAYSHEPLMDTISHKLLSETYAKMFDFRVKQIMNWIQDCREKSIKNGEWK